MDERVHAFFTRNISLRNMRLNLGSVTAGLAVVAVVIFCFVFRKKGCVSKEQEEV